MGQLLSMSYEYSTQNSLLLQKLLQFYQKDGNLDKILSIINGESSDISSPHRLVCH